VKVVEILAEANRPLVSFEIIPPKRGGSAEEIYRIIEALLDVKPPFIDVTSHAADAYYLERPDGTFERRIKRKRPGTIGLSAAIKYKYNVETVVHLLCRGFTREETEDALIELNYLGIDNVLALRGDESNYKKAVPSERSVNNYAVDLVRQIQNMNHGRYLEEILDAHPTNFCIGVGGYPEKHHEAPSLEADVRFLKAKVEAGADYVVTQMFFNNADFFRFEKLCREMGIAVPIIPGLKLLTRRRHLKSLPQNFLITIPDELVRQVEEAADDREVREIGIAHATRQVEELLNHNVPCIHFYVMQDAAAVKEVLRRVGYL